MTIKKLINRQLGPMSPPFASIKDTEVIANLDNQRRELLERLIHRTRNMYPFFMEGYRQNDSNKNKGSINNNILGDISYIEKTLSLSWDEIIKALED